MGTGFQRGAHRGRAFPEQTTDPEASHRYPRRPCDVRTRTATRAPVGVVALDRGLTLFMTILEFRENAEIRLRCSGRRGARVTVYLRRVNQIESKNKSINEFRRGGALT